MNMKTQLRKPDPVARTIQPKTRAANQAPIEAILQRYANHTVQTIGLEDDELLQGRFPVAQREPDEDELLQGKFETAQRQPENRTGLPDDLKAGVENLSGYSMDDVRVHYNSPKPAQLQALAYTQGTDIHVGPGQEKHLPHEAWHVVQQKQGRVRPTMQLQGVNINDNEGLEKEADAMGEMTNRKTAIQRMAWAATRPLGQQPIVEPRNRDHYDSNLGFGNLKINHRHIIFSDAQLLPTGPNDNIGFHCADGRFRGHGELFSEDWRRFGYTGRSIISNTIDDDVQLVDAIHINNPPGNYNLITHNCQDWVDDVRRTAGL